MHTLQNIFADPAHRSELLEDCTRLIDNEVSRKGGLSGIAIKGAYAVVKKLRPGIVRDALDHLANEFFERLEKFYLEYQHAPTDGLANFLHSRTPEVASELLGVTDVRIHKINQRSLQAAYHKLRPSAAKHVEAAVPEMLRLIEKHLPPQPQPTPQTKSTADKPPS